MPKQLKTVTPCTPILKLECLSYIMVPSHTCHDERKLRTIVFLKNSLRETPCISIFPSLSVLKIMTESSSSEEDRENCEQAIGLLRPLRLKLERMCQQCGLPSKRRQWETSLKFAGRMSRRAELAKMNELQQVIETYIPGCFGSIGTSAL